MAETSEHDSVASEELPMVSATFLRASVLFAVLAAAAVWPARGVYQGTDSSMLFLGLSLLAIALASLLSGRSSLPGRRALIVLAVVLGAIVVSTALSDFVPFGIFGSPRGRRGLISIVPAVLLLVLARGFPAELGRMLRKAAPWVVGAWAR